jgi:hypothetical protein
VTTGHEKFCLNGIAESGSTINCMNQKTARPYSAPLSQGFSTSQSSLLLARQKMAAATVAMKKCNPTPSAVVL